MIKRDITPSAARNEVLFVRTIQWLYEALEKPFLHAATRWFDEQEYEELNDSQAFIEEQIKLLLASPKVFYAKHVKDVNGKPKIFLVADTDQAEIPIDVTINNMISEFGTFGFRCTATFTPEKKNRRYQVVITREYEFTLKGNQYSYQRVDNGKY
jgi:hypothetical protein